MMCKKSVFVFRIFISLSLFFGIMLSPSFGQESKMVFTLRESIAVALDKNWSLKAKEEGVRQATAVKNQARTGFLPSLNTNYVYT